MGADQILGADYTDHTNATLDADHTDHVDRVLDADHADHTDPVWTRISRITRIRGFGRGSTWITRIGVKRGLRGSHGWI